MATHSFSQPCIATRKGAKQIEKIMKSPASYRASKSGSSVISAKDLVEKALR